MKSCLFIMHSFGGGAEKLALDLARWLAGESWQVRIACMRAVPELQKHAPEGIGYQAPPRAGFCAFLRNLLATYGEARRHDVVLGTLELQSIFWAALLAPGRAVAWVHKDIAGYLATKGAWYARIYTAVMGWALRRCRAVECVSQGVAASTKQLWPDVGNRVHTIYNPVDVEGIRARSREPLQEALQTCFAKPVVLAVGRLEAQKAFDVCIRAHAALKQRGVEHNLCILGEGTLRKELENLAAELGVSDSVFLPGRMNPYPAMARARVLAMSSVFEGFSLVIAEALCLGLPVVAMDCPSGPREVLKDGEYGVLVENGDFDAFTAALELAIYDNVQAIQSQKSSFPEDSRYREQTFFRAWNTFLIGD